MALLGKHKEYMASKPLDSRVFMIVLVAGSLTALLSAIFTIIEGLGPGASLSTLACLLMLIGLMILAFVFDKEALCHVLLCLVLNFVLLPVAFFYCGGIRSGMMLYFLTALYIVVPTVTNRKTRLIVYILSALMLSATFEVAYVVFPEWVTPVSDQAWRIDVIASFILNALCIYLVSSLTVQAYHEQAAANEELVKKLESMTVHDELTGVFNRRELFRVLEEDVMRASADDLYCMFIFDVDDFKHANDTYGHVFGDKVLCEVARCLQEEMQTIEEGEIAARYGGEEFVAVFHDADFETSYARAEKVRQKVEELRFYENPEFRVTISGGVDRCNGMRPRYALRQVDDLLFLAKTTGKNQITRKF
ncbi:MAG: GGDEF domain-containing protein [Eubacterium sp.]|nr:GGDEF domain-containing protein [Eubacterium sp.]